MFVNILDQRMGKTQKDQNTSLWLTMISTNGQMHSDGMSKLVQYFLLIFYCLFCKTFGSTGTAILILSKKLIFFCGILWQGVYNYWKYWKYPGILLILLEKFILAV